VGATGAGCRRLQILGSSVAGRDYLLGSEFSGGDIQLSFVGELAGRWADRSRYPNLDAWVRRFQSRPTYLAALARGGAYALAE
jgi:glutathione S-transferase